MKPHTKIYFNYFKYDATDFIPCEICGKMANDIHHIHARGMGGTKQPDNINNLMALCRNCHIEYGDKKHLIEFLEDIHNKKICDKSV
jgi:5-methylcytosine-specific restriction endonuclease McrA